MHPNNKLGMPYPKEILNQEPLKKKIQSPLYYYIIPSKHKKIVEVTLLFLKIMGFLIFMIFAYLKKKKY